MRHEESIIVLDFGSQYTQLIARRIRELGVYSEIKPFDFDLNELDELNPKGIILSGGPSSVYDENAPLPDKELFNLGYPILGICYGLQVIAHLSGGKVAGALHREYGRAELTVDDNSDLFFQIDNFLTVWMSHGDRLENMTDDFNIIGHTSNAPIAAVRHKNKPFSAVKLFILSL